MQKTSVLKTDRDKQSHQKNLANDLIKKCQMRFNTFIQQHRDITLSGTKRFEDKSGEYYLKNLGKFQKNNLNIKSITSSKISNSNNHNRIKVNKKKLCDELVPIPKMKKNNKFKSEYEKKNLNNAVNNAKYIRRYQYSKNIAKKQIQQYKENKKLEKEYFNKIKLIQIWWKTIFQIIKLQKYVRGYLYRNKFYKNNENKDKYFDKVVNLVKKLKKIFWKKYVEIVLSFKENRIKFYFNKWKDIIYKKIILKNIIKLTSGKKIADVKKKYYYISKSCKDINENDKIHINHNLNKINIKKLKNNNYLIDTYNSSLYKNNHNLISSLSLLSLHNKRNKISLGIDISSITSFKNINTSKKNTIKKNSISNSDKHENINKTDKNILKEIYNINKNIMNETKKINNLKDYRNNKLNSKNNSKATLNNNNNNYNKNNLNINRKEKHSNKNSKINKKINSNIEHGYNTNPINTNKKIKKNRVYENELNLYNQYQTLEANNTDNNYLTMNNELENHIESVLNESHISNILENSIINEDKNIIDFSLKNNYPFINKIPNNQQNIKFLKHAFQIWKKKYISKFLLKKLLIIKKAKTGAEVLNRFFINRNYYSFLNRIKKYYNIELIKDLFEYLEKKLLIKYLISFSNKFCIFKYFNKYKFKISKKMLLEKLVKYQKNKIRNKKKIINRNIENIFFSGTNFLNQQFLTEIPINDNCIKGKFNLENEKSNNCFIINNLNYNNNTNKFDIKLSYELDNKNENNNTKYIFSKTIQIPRRSTKAKKSFINLYKNFDNERNCKEYKNINMMISNHPIISHNDIIASQISKYNTINVAESSYNENNLNKSEILFKNRNKSKWDLITKNNQLMMVINIIEHHRKLKEFKLLKESFSRLNGLKKNKNGNIFNSNNITNPIVYEKKTAFSKNDNGLHKKNLTQKEYSTDYTNNKNSVYIKKTITGPSNYTKKNTFEKKEIIIDDENDILIYNNKKIKHGNMSPENYYNGFKKLNKIEEMEISFGNSKEKKNFTSPIYNMKKINFEKTKFVNPFMPYENKETKDEFKENNNNNKEKDIIEEEINEVDE